MRLKKDASSGSALRLLLRTGSPASEDATRSVVVAGFNPAKRRCSLQGDSLGRQRARLRSRQLARRGLVGRVFDATIISIGSDLGPDFARRRLVITARRG